MRRITKATVALLAAGVALATAPALFAQDAQNPTNPRTGHDMMDHGMMGRGTMGDMPGMMKQMRGMMDACNKMMDSMANQPGSSPEQPRETPPAEPK